MRRIIALARSKIRSAARNDVSVFQNSGLEIIHDVFSKRFFFRLIVSPEHHLFGAMMGSKLHVPLKVLVSFSLFRYVEDLLDRRILAIAKEQRFTNTGTFGQSDLKRQT